VKQGTVTATALLLGVTLIWAIGSTATPPRRGTIRMKDFKTRGARDDGSTEWTLQGANAIRNGGNMVLEKVALELHPEDGGSVVTLTSPACSVDLGTKAVNSDQAILVQSPSFRLSGSGYDIDLNEQTLHIRSQVKMLVRGVQLRNTGDDGATRSAQSTGQVTRHSKEKDER